ncbi:MAG: hypothetical protein U1F76_28895 [Candidatus Competibacteraceae bacterium]
MSYEDLFSKAKRIADEEGLFRDDSKSHEILPNPAKLNAQREKLTRVAERLGQETGVDLLKVVEYAKDVGSMKPPNMEIVDSKAHTAANMLQPISNQKNNNRQSMELHQRDEVDPESIIQEQLDILESWVAHNISSARKDSIRFWVLKIPAISCSVSVSAVEAFGYGKLVILLGLVTAFCVGIDALFPGGQ